MGGAVTLAIVLVVLVVIFIIYKRRRQAPKLSTDVVAVDAVQMQNRSPGEHSQDNQVHCMLYVLLDVALNWIIQNGK